MDLPILADKPRAIRSGAPFEPKEMPLLSPLQACRISNNSLRLDPLNSLPVHAGPMVQQTIDYCELSAATTCGNLLIKVTVFQTLAARSANYISVDGHQIPFLSIGFPIYLQSAMCFEAHIATWRTVRIRSHMESVQHDQFVIVHQTNALRMLRQRLQEEPKTLANDVAITMACLVTLEVSYSLP